MTLTCVPVQTIGRSVLKIIQGTFRVHCIRISIDLIWLMIRIGTETLRWEKRAKYINEVTRNVIVSLEKRKQVLT